MVVAGWVISLLAILLVPILFGSIPQKAGGCLPPSCYKPNCEAIRLPIARFRRRYKRGSQLRQALPDASECFSSAGRISDRTHLWAR